MGQSYHGRLAGWLWEESPRRGSAIGHPATAVRLCVRSTLKRRAKAPPPLLLSCTASPRTHNVRSTLLVSFPGHAEPYRGEIGLFRTQRISCSSVTSTPSTDARINHGCIIFTQRRHLSSCHDEPRDSAAQRCAFLQARQRQWRHRQSQKSHI